MEMKRNAKGNDTELVLSGVSVITIIAARPPKIRKEMIITEFSTCRTLSVFILSGSVYSGRVVQESKTLEKDCVTCSLAWRLLTELGYVKLAYGEI